MFKKANKKKTLGFTLIELITVICIVAILSSIGIYSFGKVQANARDSQRSSKLTVVSEALEKYYNQNGEYPSCADMTADAYTISVRTLKDIDLDALSTPSSASGTNSFICSAPTADNFGYIGGGSEYTLEYFSESNQNVVSVKSLHS